MACARRFRSSGNSPVRSAIQPVKQFVPFFANRNQTAIETPHKLCLITGQGCLLCVQMFLRRPLSGRPDSGLIGRCRTRWLPLRLSGWSGAARQISVDQGTDETIFGCPAFFDRHHCARAFGMLRVSRRVFRQQPAGDAISGNGCGPPGLYAKIRERRLRPVDLAEPQSFENRPFGRRKIWNH